MAKHRVAILGTVGKAIFIDPDATDGATIGLNLRLPDGTVPSLEELAEIICSYCDDEVGDPTPFPFLPELPDCCGIIVRDCSGESPEWLCREITVAGGVEVAPTYVVFKATDTWTVPEGVESCDALIVAGGGASSRVTIGNCIGTSGGGGAGGMRVAEDITLTPGAEVAVVVGAGGVWGAFAGSMPTPGGNSSFGALTAFGGGVGQRVNTTANNVEPENGGGDGGSGGGAAGGTTDEAPCVDTEYGSRSGGAGTPGQGTSGGSVSNPGRGSAGGGGAAQAGQSPAGTTAGKGGDGVRLSDIGWWDQEIANLLNPMFAGVEADFPVNFTAVEWQDDTAYPAGTVVWHEYQWRLFYANQDLNSVEPPPTDGRASSPWKRVVHALAGGGAGDDRVSAVTEPGLGNGGEGGSDADCLGPTQNTGSGGPPTDTVTSQTPTGGAAGIVIVRYPAQGDSCRLTVDFGDGQGGDPILDLCLVEQCEDGDLRAITIDSWGRVTCNRAVVAADIPDLAISQITNLQAELDGKEDDLGDPAADGYVLSSTAAGVRSWVDTAAFGGVLPVVTGEVPPVLVYLDDGSLVYSGVG